MKKLLVLIFLIFINVIFASPYYHYRYLKKDGKVYVVTSMIGYENTLREIKEVDYDTFVENTIYGKDKNHVYFMGTVMKEADPLTFKEVYGVTYDGDMRAYGKDKNYVFYNNAIIPNADSKTFEIAKGVRYWLFGKDKNHVYVRDTIIDGINPDGLEILENEYIRNKKNLYFYNYNGGYTLIKNANPNTFKDIYYDGRYNFAKDKNNVFYLKEPIENSDPATFEIIDRDYSKDKNNVYYIYSSKLMIIKGANPTTFQVLEKSNWYAKDEKYVYYQGKKIEKGNVKSFEIINSEYTKDENNAYYRGSIIKNVDVKSFEFLGYSGYSKDKNNIYYEDKKVDKADVATFKYLGSDMGAHYYFDKDYVFLRGILMPEATPENYK